MNNIAFNSHKPFPVIRYTLIAAFLFVIGPAIALAAKADRVEGFDRTFVMGQAEALPSGFSEADEKALTAYLKIVAKKKNTQAYEVGYALPDDIGFKPLPKKVAAKLENVPAGYRAVRVGNQILLMSEVTRKIADRVAL